MYNDKILAYCQQINGQENASLAMEELNKQILTSFYKPHTLTSPRPSGFVCVCHTPFASCKTKFVHAGSKLKII